MLRFMFVNESDAMPKTVEIFKLSDMDKLPVDLLTIHWKIFNDHAYIELHDKTAVRFAKLFPNHPEIPKSKVGYYKLFGNAAYMVMLNWELEP